MVSGGSHGWGCTSTCTWCNLHWRDCTRIRRMRGRVRRFPGGSENIFRERIDVPQRRGVLLLIGPRGRRLRGVFFALRRRPPLRDSRFLLLFGGSPPRSRFLGVGVFLVFSPLPRPPRIRTSVRMVDAIVGWVDGESVPFVNRPFESEIHGTVNFTYFCCVLLVTWCYRVLLSCYLRPK